MNGVAFEGIKGLEGRIEHDIRIAGFETSVDLDMDVEETGYLAFERFEALFDSERFLAFFRFAQFRAKFPKNNVLNHNIIYNLQCTMYNLFYSRVDGGNAEGEGDEVFGREAGIVEVLDEGFAPTEGLDGFIEIGVSRFVAADDSADEG